MKLVKIFKLNECEKNLLEAILWYKNEHDSNFAYDMLDGLKYDIVARREYEEGFGEVFEWDEDGYERILIYKSDELAKKEEQIIKELEKKFDE